MNFEGIYNFNKFGWCNFFIVLHSLKMVKTWVFNMLIVIGGYGYGLDPIKTLMHPKIVRMIEF